MNQRCIFIARHPTCYAEVANLLRTCLGETDVMDFELNA